MARRIESWWIGQPLEVNVCNGATQTTMLILTPAMPKLPDSRKPKLENDGRDLRRIEKFQE